MSAWPEFTNEPLDDARSWSATFDSFDERHDDVYYRVTLSDGAAFMVQVSATFSTDRWVDDEARTTLRTRIAAVAVTGQSNTAYRGAVLSQ